MTKTSARARSWSCGPSADADVVAAVAITRRLPEEGLRPLREASLDVRMREADDAPGRSELLAWVAGADAVITLLSDRVDDAFLDAAGPGLRVVANYAVGHDNVDLEACRRRGVAVSTTPGVLDEATADLTWTLLLAVTRRLLEGHRLMTSGTWTGWQPMQLLGRSLQGATLGIVGLGRIGRAVARRAGAFGMSVRYHSRRPVPQAEEELGAERVPLERLLDGSDVLSLHCPLTDETHHLIDADALARMKPGAILINTARGPVVDEEALVHALRSGQLGGAGLDVFEHEPAVHEALPQLPNVVLAPHLGSATVETRTAMARTCSEAVAAVLAGAADSAPGLVVRPG